MNAFTIVPAQVYNWQANREATGKVSRHTLSDF